MERRNTPRARSGGGQGNYPARDASPGQVAHLKRLLTDNELYDGAFDRLWKRLRVHEEDLLRPGDGTRMTSYDAGQALNWITGKYGDLEQPPVGVYRVREGRQYRYFVIREFEPADKPGQKIRYAKELVPLRATQGSRQSRDGQAVRYDEEPAKGMEWTLRLTDLMTEEDVEALSVKFGKCIACGHKLFDDDSQRLGIGPVCRGRQRDAIAQREALVLVTEVPS